MKHQASSGRFAVVESSWARVDRSRPTVRELPPPCIDDGEVAGATRHLARVLRSDELGRLDAAAPSEGAPDLTHQGIALRHRQAKFFEEFATVTERLAALARKELARQPFSADDELFLKKTIDWRGGGSGPPTYDGWYPRLVYGPKPMKWDPTVTDVHTDPESSRVLQAGVGDVFTQPAEKRLTDPEWQARIQAGKAPPRPSFTNLFRAPQVPRQLGPPKR